MKRFICVVLMVAVTALLAACTAASDLTESPAPTVEATPVASEPVQTYDPTFEFVTVQTPAPTVPPLEEQHIPDYVRGTYDPNIYAYKNEFFNFQFEIPSDSIVLTREMSNMGDFTSASNSVGVSFSIIGDERSIPANITAADLATLNTVLENNFLVISTQEMETVFDDGVISKTVENDVVIVGQNWHYIKSVGEYNDKSGVPYEYSIIETNFYYKAVNGYLGIFIIQTIPYSEHYMPAEDFLATIVSVSPVDE